MENSKHIALKPIGGLCNRLRAIDSALTIASAGGHSLKVLWERNSGLNALWSDLFEPPEQFEILNIGDNLLSKLSHRTVLGSSVLLPIFRAYKRTGYDQVVYSGDFPGLFVQNFDFFSWSEENRIYIQSLSRFAMPDVPFRFLRPERSIQRRVDTLLSGVEDDLVGFHIRRTDHAKAMQSSPLELFYKQAETLLNAQPKTFIYLACDDAEVKATFKQRFGKAVWIRDIPLARDSASGIQEALIDLLILSRCREIFGSQGSSFSTTAAEIGGIPCHMLSIKGNTKPH